MGRSHQDMVGKILIEEPAEEIELLQAHPSSYWIYKKVVGTKSMYEPVRVDEGFALPVEEIMPEIRVIEKKLVPRRPDIRILNDLAIGYSCIGDVDSSLRFLRRVRRKAPEDLETRVRWIWYRRFSSSSKGSVRMKQQMKNLVEENPCFAMGRTFLGVWHMFDLLETDDPQEILRLVNLCLHELARADENMPKDLHQRTLIQYAKARILTADLLAFNDLENPERVIPRDAKVTVMKDKLSYNAEPKSVNAIKIIIEN